MLKFVFGVESKREAEAVAHLLFAFECNSAPLAGKEARLVLFRRYAEDVGGINRRGEFDPDKVTAFWLHKGASLRQVSAKGVTEYPAAAGEDDLQLLDGLVQLLRLKEVLHGKRGERGGPPPTHYTPVPFEPVNKRLPGVYPAQPQPRGKDLGESTGRQYDTLIRMVVVHEARRVPLAPLKAEKVVGLIREYNKLKFSRQLHQPVAARRAHGAPRRVVKVGYRVYDPRPHSVRPDEKLQPLHIHTLLVHRYAHYPRLAHVEYICGNKVRRILHDHRIEIMQKQPGGERNGVRIPACQK
mmetsp:Transcript_4355/g.12209  ORF Transcript_4355/g.12209 Transcript_4355/m.12209 type:complete len:298 (-) Transcript_4355:310-1203(-)